MIFTLEYKTAGLLNPWMTEGKHRRYSQVRLRIVRLRAIYPDCEYRVTARWA